MTSINTFVEASGKYASFRPCYPHALFEWIADQCFRRRRAWDCATGSGQAAIGLAEYFEEIHATDIAAEQIAHAIERPNIIYRVAPAEACLVEDRSIDLIAVAQALHWFDFNRFWPEVRRVAAPKAFFCAWGYDWFECPQALDAELVRPFRDIISPFWASNNGILWRGYRPEEIKFPFQALLAPSFAIEVAWTPAQLLDYMCTWSAYKRSRTHPDATAAMDALLARIGTWLDASELFPIRMPLKILAAKLPE